MTFSELDATLPNGFHDANIRTVVIDYAAKSMTLLVDFWVGNLEGPNREEYRPARVNITGLAFCVIEPPDPNRRPKKEGYLTVSGDSASSDTLPSLDKLLATFDRNASCYRFYVHDWNSFIYIAANEAEVSWL